MIPNYLIFFINNYHKNFPPSFKRIRLSIRKCHLWRILLGSTRYYFEKLTLHQTYKPSTHSAVDGFLPLEPVAIFELGGIIQGSKITWISHSFSFPSSFDFSYVLHKSRPNSSFTFFFHILYKLTKTFSQFFQCLKFNLK